MQNGLPFKILLVDDDADDRSILDDAFLELDYACEVKKFKQGGSLLDYLGQVQPELYPALIVLDNQLPGLDASALLDILKQNPSYQSIPVIVYTTTLTASKEEQLLAKGAFACYEKGDTMQEVVEFTRGLKDLAEKGHKRTN